MNNKIDKLKRFRLFLLNQISSLTAEQLNKIPQGYNNNIIWNLGHIASSAQVICYKRAGLPVTIDEKYFTPFLTNTRPGDFINAEEIETIKQLLISTIDTLQTDFDNKMFANYTKSENIERVYGIALNTINDAIDFLLYHEGLHIGYILSQKRFV